MTVCGMDGDGGQWLVNRTKTWVFTLFLVRESVLAVIFKISSSFPDTLHQTKNVQVIFVMNTHHDLQGGDV
jgi:hypothetical protein